MTTPESQVPAQVELETARFPGAFVFGWTWTTLVVVALGAASIAMVVATKRIGERRIVEDIPHESAVVEMQSALAAAHLRLEDFFTVDPATDLADAWRLLDRVNELAGALLEGGLVPQGPEIRSPLSDPKLRAQVEQVQSLLRDYRQIASRRVELSGQAGLDATSDELYDQALGELLGAATVLEDAVKKRTERNRRNAADFFRVLLVAWALLIGLAVGGLASRELQRKRAVQALRLSEERLSATLRSIADGVVTTDARGRITFLNRVGAELLQVETAEALGRPLAEVYRPSTGETSEAGGGSVERRLLEETMVGPTERCLMLGSGEPLPIEESAAPIRDVGGAPTGEVHVFRDVSERQRAEAALRESEDRLRHSQKLEAIGRLAGGLAHDINNYLATISSESELVKMLRREDREVTGKMDAVLASVSKASKLLKQLLAFSRRQPPRLEVVSLSEVAGGLAPMLRRLIGENVRLEMRLAGDLPPVEVDPSQLEQVLVNLVVNAREAIADGGEIRVVTSTARIPDARARAPWGGSAEERVLLAVSDTGCGIPDGIRDKIFEPFFTTKGERGNSGLGLATVYGIVGQCRGGVEVESEAGQGTTFRIHFPICAGTARHGVSEAEQELQAGARGCSILLVEDNAELRSAACSLLEAMGHRVEVAASGEEALDSHGRSPSEIDLVVTDFVLPDFSGREVLERIWVDTPGLPAIVISGYAESSSFEDLLTERRAVFLAKPFAASALAQAIEDALRPASGAADVSDAGAAGAESRSRTS